jgi:hypothetical protein
MKLDYVVYYKIFSYLVIQIFRNIYGMSAEPRFANIIQILYNMNIYGMSAEPRFANIIQILYNMNI